MNKIGKDNMNKKIQEREKMANMVMNKITMDKNTQNKDILQNNQYENDMILENNTLSRDYRKEKAMEITKSIENRKKNMKIPRSDKRGIDNFEAMNNKLIYENMRPGN